MEKFDLKQITENKPLFYTIIICVGLAVIMFISMICVVASVNNSAPKDGSGKVKAERVIKNDPVTLFTTENAGKALEVQALLAREQIVATKVDNGSKTSLVLREYTKDQRDRALLAIDKSGLLDVISSMPKSEAINMLTRTMSPQIIICDEIGGNEAEAIIEAQNTGVSLIASAHCENPQKLLLRGRMKLLLERDLFKLCVILGYDGGYTCEIAETEAFL